MLEPAAGRARFLEKVRAASSSLALGLLRTKLEDLSSICESDARARPRARRAPHGRTQQVQPPDQRGGRRFARLPRAVRALMGSGAWSCAAPHACTRTRRKAAQKKQP